MHADPGKHIVITLVDYTSTATSSLTSPPSGGGGVVETDKQSRLGGTVHQQSGQAHNKVEAGRLADPPQPPSPPPGCVQYGYIVEASRSVDTRRRNVTICDRQSSPAPTPSPTVAGEEKERWGETVVYRSETNVIEIVLLSKPAASLLSSDEEEASPNNFLLRFQSKLFI